MISDMGKKKTKQIEGQLRLPISNDMENYVVQANDLIAGKQGLSLDTAKFMRTIIMQIKPEDTEFNEYHVTTSQAAKLLGVSKSNLYKKMRSVSKEITDHPVDIFSHEQKKFVTYPWVSMVYYDDTDGLVITINEKLRPFLLGLKEHYTQYHLSEIMQMRSIFAIRIFELLQKDNLFKYLPEDGTYIDLKVEDIRIACDCEKKLTRYSDFKKRVLDKACEEIERTTTYTVSYTEIKNGRTIETIRFHVNMEYHKR